MSRISRVICQSHERDFGDFGRALNSDHHRIEVVMSLLQYELGLKGYVISGWLAEILLSATLHFHKKLINHQMLAYKKLSWGFNDSLNELLDALAPLIAYLAEGIRSNKNEYRFVALIYDKFNDAKSIHFLQNYFEDVFAWIAIDAKLRKLGNDNGFRLGL